MSEPHDPHPSVPFSSQPELPPSAPPRPTRPPARPAPPPPPARGSPLLGCAFTVSFLFNLLAGVLLLIVCIGVLGLRRGDTPTPLPEKFHSGNANASNKIAIIHLDGVIMEGALNYVHRQIEQAARDEHVKAVVLRINSPGGSITASDDLHNRLTQLRDGFKSPKTSAKPLIVSMGSLAASGGYYVAMPAKKIFAERTTLTGSIGVYASFPNVAGLAEKNQVKMITIKQGNIKDSGSPFKEMTDEEKQVWQDMVDDAYNQFLQVVADGRKDQELTPAKLVERFPVKPIQAGPPADKKKVKPYERYRADGGIYTAAKAKDLKLIDQIGYLDDAIAAAQKAAGLGDDFRVVEYERPFTFAGLLGVRSTQPGALLDPSRLSNGLTPRLWYLAPGCEAAGFLAAVGGE
jgi:protease-4